MPYLPASEYSVDMLVEKGNVIATVARRKKEGILQYLEQSGTALVRQNRKKQYRDSW